MGAGAHGCRARRSRIGGRRRGVLPSRRKPGRAARGRLVRGTRGAPRARERGPWEGARCRTSRNRRRGSDGFAAGKNYHRDRRYRCPARVSCRAGWRRALGPLPDLASVRARMRALVLVRQMGPRGIPTLVYHAIACRTASGSRRQPRGHAPYCKHNGTRPRPPTQTRMPRAARAQARGAHSWARCAREPRANASPSGRHGRVVDLARPRRSHRMAGGGRHRPSQARGRRSSERGCPRSHRMARATLRASRVDGPAPTGSEFSPIPTWGEGWTKLDTEWTASHPPPNH
jgi:hypothetical protein